LCRIGAHFSIIWRLQHLLPSRTFALEKRLPQIGIDERGEDLYTYALLGLAFIAQQPGEFEKARVLEAVQNTGLTQKQMPALLEAAKYAHASAEDYQRKVAEHSAQQDALSDIVAALAAGRSLSQEERARFDAAARARKAIEDEFEGRVKQSVDYVLNAMTEEQRYNLMVPPQVRQQASEALNRIRSASNDEWRRVSMQYGWVVMRENMDRLRQSMGAGRPGPGQGPGRGGVMGGRQGRGGGDTRADRQRSQEQLQSANQMRQQMQEIRRSAEEFMNRVRAGDPNAMRHFERSFAQAQVREGQAEARLRDTIRQIILDPAAVPAIEARIGQTGQG
jgi:hypothetical protein